MLFMKTPRLYTLFLPVLSILILLLGIGGVAADAARRRNGDVKLANKLPRLTRFAAGSTPALSLRAKASSRKAWRLKRCALDQRCTTTASHLRCAAHDAADACTAWCAWRALFYAPVYLFMLLRKC